MSDLVCGWLLERRVKKDGTVVPERKCGRPAVATYSKLNPQARRPDEPKFMVHPMCDTHDTPKAQKAAPEQGYERTELS